MARRDGGRRSHPPSPPPTTLPCALTPSFAASNHTAVRAHALLRRLHSHCRVHVAHTPCMCTQPADPPSTSLVPDGGQVRALLTHGAGGQSRPPDLDRTSPYLDHISPDLTYISLGSHSSNIGGDHVAYQRCTRRDRAPTRVVASSLSWYQSNHLVLPTTSHRPLTDWTSRELCAHSVPSGLTYHLSQTGRRRP
jgi:hypothetical protein